MVSILHLVVVLSVLIVPALSFLSTSLHRHHIHTIPFRLKEIDNVNISSREDDVEARLKLSGESVKYFRGFIKQEAKFNRRLKGELYEIGEGVTEILIQGPRPRIEGFIRWLKKEGTSIALKEGPIRLYDVTYSDVNHQGYSSFSIRE